MGALFMVMVDMVVDPLSVLGERWFLGRIFWYDPPGPYFGVPISNYLGWYLVAAISVAVFQVLDSRLNRAPGKPFGVLVALPSRALLGPILYAGIVLFGISMLFVIHAPEIAWTSVFIFLPFASMALHIVTRSDSYGDGYAIARHLADFPFNRDNFGAAPLPYSGSGWREKPAEGHHSAACRDSEICPAPAFLRER
jgi:putative membrane protein